MLLERSSICYHSSWIRFLCWRNGWLLLASGGSMFLKVTLILWMRFICAASGGCASPACNRWGQVRVLLGGVTCCPRVTLGQWVLRVGPLVCLLCPSSAPCPRELCKEMFMEIRRAPFCPPSPSPPGTSGFLSWSHSETVQWLIAEPGPVHGSLEETLE